MASKGSTELQSPQANLSLQKDYGAKPFQKTSTHEEIKVTWNNQHGFLMGKSCLIILIAVYDKIYDCDSLLFSTGESIPGELCFLAP